MIRWRTLVALVLAVVWVPVTYHCLLEKAGVFPEDGCCPTAQPAGNPLKEPPVPGCCMVEKAPFQFAPAKCLAFFPASLVMFRGAAEPNLKLEIPGGPVLSARVVCPNTWQFLLRTALAPRAPSFA